jgi:hypothetical protein
VIFGEAWHLDFVRFCDFRGGLAFGFCQFLCLLALRFFSFFVNLLYNNLSVFEVFIHSECCEIADF